MNLRLVPLRVFHLLCRSMKLGLAMASAFFMAAVSPAAGESSALLGSLNQIEAGQWELRSSDAQEAVVRLCLIDRTDIVQVRHSTQRCERTIVHAGSNTVDVAYQCAHGGQGRTRIRIETSRLIQINTQGIADGMPFAVDYEGRRTGTCPARGRS